MESSLPRVFILRIQQPFIQRIQTTFPYDLLQYKLVLTCYQGWDRQAKLLPRVTVTVNLTHVKYLLFKRECFKLEVINEKYYNIVSLPINSKYHLLYSICLLFLCSYIAKNRNSLKIVSILTEWPFLYGQKCCIRSKTRWRTQIFFWKVSSLDPKMNT